MATRRWVTRRVAPIDHGAQCIGMPSSERHPHSVRQGVVVAKYDPLFEHLSRAGDATVTLTFDDIEALVGPLPPSATRHEAWWSNDAGGGHVQARAWLGAGREMVAVDRDARRVTFSAATWRRGS